MKMRKIMSLLLAAMMLCGALMAGMTVQAKLSFNDTDGHWATENYVQYGTKYALNFVGDGFEAVAENSATNFFHVHSGLVENYDGIDEPVNKAAIDALLQKNPNAKEGVDYFELYDAICQTCKRVTPMIAAPDLPYKVNIYDESGNQIGQRPATDTKGTYAYNNFRNISGVNAIYENDGTIALNIHYPSKMDGEQMFITDENGMIMKYSDTLEVNDDRTQKYTATASSEASSKIVVDEKEIARYGDGIISSAQMITINGFSAADIDKTLYVARYTPSSSTETQLMGITHMISVRDYLNEVIKNEENTQEDKLVAAALLNYANASTTALGTKKDENPKIIPTEIDLLEFGDYLTKAGSTSTYYDTKVADNGETGAEDDPIIIDSAEELVYLCKASGNETDGKYYKVADDIAGFNLSTDKLDINGTLAGNSLASGKTNLDIVMGSGKNHAGGTPGFQGHFDGNGATVYGLYQTPDNNAGLFSTADAGAVISNLALKNCYFTSAAGNYQVGAIAAVTNGSSYGKSTNGFIWFNNCTVANNYLYNSSTSVTRSGILLGASSDIIYVDNCLAYGNDATYGSGDKMSLYSCANNSVLVSSAPAIPDGLTVVDDGAETARYYNIVRNSIFMGFNPINVADGFGSRSKDLKGYVNCYTDSNVDTDVDKNGKTALQYFYVTTTAPYITKISAADALGAAAETNMPNLTWGTDWYAGGVGEYIVDMVRTFDMEYLSSTKCDGIGLYRTEIPFMTAEKMPDVSQQISFYKKLIVK